MPQMVQPQGFQGVPRQTQEQQDPLGGGFLGKLLQTAIPVSLGMMLGSAMGPGGSLLGALGGVLGQSAGQAGIGQWGGGQQAEHAAPAQMQASGMAQPQGAAVPQPPPATNEALGQLVAPGAAQAQPEEDPSVFASAMLEGWGRAGQ